MMNNQQSFTYSAFIIDVYDGDTVTADVDLGFGVCLKKQSFRLLGINTPELKGSSKNQANIAKERLIQLVNKKNIIIKTHKDNKEKYGRWLAELFLPNTTKSVNEQLIEEGLAVRYTIK